MIKKDKHKIYIEEHHSNEIDYDIYFVFGELKKLQELETKITGRESSENIGGMMVSPDVGREVYIMINTYKDGVTDKRKTRIKKDDFYRGTVIHEITHAIRKIFDYLQRPMDLASDEPLAYYMEYWTKKGLEFIERCKKFDIY